MMERAAVCKYINEGADFSLRVLGDAEHMEYYENEYYSFIRPKSGEKGGTSVFNIRLEGLPDDKLEQKVAEIQSLNMHVWWGFFLSERMLCAIWKGREMPVQLPEPNDDEIAMAMLPEEKLAYDPVKNTITVKKVDNVEAFKVWTGINNEVLGYPIMHPVNHYHLCKRGIMSCYLGYDGDTPAGISAILTNEGVSSLEFVATLENYRRRGLARAVSIAAIEDAFKNGSKIITVRPFGVSKKLYKSLGFKVY